ncbi:MAG: hypothetical protein ACI9MJ_000986 [Alphaproteobacteria bacterium]|jgi:hypothetical protein
MSGSPSTYPVVNDRGWHLDKRVSVGHIVTTLAVAVSVVIWLNNIDKRISVVEEIAQQHAERFDRTEKRWEQELINVRRMLERIEDKLDRKADRSPLRQN